MRIGSLYTRAIAFALVLSAAPLLLAQTTAPAAGAGDKPDKPALTQPELEQMLAPVALYPDSLLTQILMASTYPVEIVQADRFAKANKTLKGEALTKELEKQTWDASVKSLVNFPEILSVMSEKLDLTVKLGDAFLAQQADVMNTVQKLRAKAQAEGNLKSTEQQKVSVQPAPPPESTTTVVVQPTTPPPAQIITIEPSDPQVIYVPQYNPTVVYGGWPYPSYPPYPYYPAPYYPPGYVASNVVSFGLGVAAGAAWGYAWGHSDWGHGDVDIDVDRNTNINNNIDRSKYKNEINNRRNEANRTGANRTGANRTGGANSWQHDPSHRGGAAYPNKATAQRYGGADSARNAQSREAYRGRTDAGGGTGSLRTGTGGTGGAGVSNRAGGDTGSFRTGTGGAGGGTSGLRTNTGGGSGSFRTNSASGGGSAQNRAGGSNNAFSSMDRGGSGARVDSQRGQASRAASPAPRPSGGGGAARSSGGGGGGRSGGGGGRSGGGGRR